MTTKEDFLRKFNNAFIEHDINYIIDSTTNDILWTMVGDKTIRGKEDLAVAMNEMKDTSGLEISVDTMIIDGDKAAVDGNMSFEDKQGNRKTYGFCDLYKFRNDGELKISEMRSYIVPTNMHNEKA
ncbi:MAG TPA: nuclear transport factor 2 family protein [Gillisia sp.]|nr:nuclear transport factor 2 family protein [Gillisia sp.]